MSMRFDDRGHRGPSAPARNRSPAYHVVPHGDIPPVPPIPQEHLDDQRRLFNNSAKGSGSSGSTYQRTDPDTPASDVRFPPTPKDNALARGLLGQTMNQISTSNIARAAKTTLVTGPLYYDYTEDFERDDYVAPDADTVHTGYSARFRTIVEERTMDQTTQRFTGSAPLGVVEGSPTAAEDIAELPASPVVPRSPPKSPVPRRLTRALVLDHTALSPTDDETSADDNNPSEPVAEMEDAGADTGDDETTKPSPQPETAKDNRHSVFSQPTTSLVDSSTVESAVHGSIPMVTGNGTTTTNIGTTEDGMSDLLDGYQRTATNENVVVADEELAVEEAADKKSNHAPKSSDEQSFKSCTNVPEQANKGSDAKSFTTCKDAVTPERAISMPSSKWPASNMVQAEARLQRPASEMSLSVPGTVLRKKVSIPPRESSFTKAASRLRTSSKHSSRPGSTVASISSSIDGVSQQPPVVPSRESSASKEARRTKGLAGLFSRGLGFSRAHSGLSKPQSRDEDAKPQSGDEATVQQELAQPNTAQHNDSHEADKDKPLPDLPATPARTQSLVSPVPASTTPDDVLAANRRLSCNPDIPPGEPRGSKDDTTASACERAQHEWSASSSYLADPSSMYSPDNVSSMFKARAQSSPAGHEHTASGSQNLSPTESGQRLDHARRESQSTTHLVRPRRSSLNMQHDDTAEPPSPQSVAQEESTTDLRLSVYKRGALLPALKEESHEDSSLNTSASNLKHSNVRLPRYGQSSMNASVDDTTMLGRRPSTMSRPKSSLGLAHDLPSLQFSSFDVDMGELRSSKSYDVCTDVPAEAALDGTARVASDGCMRAKYKGLSAGLEEGQKQEAGSRGKTMTNLASIRRPSSLQEHTATTQELVAEINNLDIPSVAASTQRWQEMVGIEGATGSCGDTDSIGGDAIIEHVREELQEVAPAPKRSSARLRPISGSSQLVVVDDAVYEEWTGKEKVVASSGARGAQGALVEVGSEKSGAAASVKAHGKAPLVEQDAASPSAGATRTRSSSVGAQVALRSPDESRLSSRSARSLTLTTTTPAVNQTDTRPWNSDKNYPWQTTLQSFDISLSAAKGTRGSPHPGPSPLRLRLSDSLEPGILSSRESAPTSPDRPNAKCHKYPSSPALDASGFPSAPTKLHRNNLSHEAGDRYPTSSLTSPTNVHLPEPTHLPDRLSESDDDTLSPRTYHRAKFWRKHRLTANIESSAGGIERAASHTTVVPSDANQPKSRSNRSTFTNAKGMSRINYRRHKMLRGVKRAWSSLKQIFHRRQITNASTSESNGSGNGNVGSGSGYAEPAAAPMTAGKLTSYGLNHYRVGPTKA
jgi:serine/arginine repetitive matrix protein 2